MMQCKLPHTAKQTMEKIGYFQCACKFYRAEEFGPAELVEPCAYHSKQTERANNRIAEADKRANDAWAASYMERESAEYWKKRAEAPRGCCRTFATWHDLRAMLLLR